jgi:hypothetical protein
MEAYGKTFKAEVEMSSRVTPCGKFGGWRQSTVAKKYSMADEKVLLLAAYLSISWKDKERSLAWRTGNDRGSGL